MRITIPQACAAAALLLAGAVRAEDVGQDAANEAYVEKTKQTCMDAARARGLNVSKVEHIGGAGKEALDVRMAVKGGKDVTCRYSPIGNTVTFPGLPDSRPEAGRDVAVRICEAVADKQDIRIGRFDELKHLDGRRVEVKFDRPFLGKRHTCLVDHGKNLVSFDDGKPVALPAVASPK